MTALAIQPLQRYCDEAVRRPNGVSAQSRTLSKLFSAVDEYIDRSIVIGAGLQDGINDILGVVEECSHENWDGYGAQGVSRAAVSQAILFIRQIPLGVTIPEVVPEPDGGIGLEWTDQHQKSLTVCFDGKPTITFACLLGGGTKLHGSARYIGSIPQNVREILLQYFPRRSKKPWSSLKHGTTDTVHLFA